MIARSGHVLLQCNNLNEGKTTGRDVLVISPLSSPSSPSQRPCSVYTKHRYSCRVRMLSMVLLLKVMRMDGGRQDLFICYRKCRSGYAHFNNDALFIGQVTVTVMYRKLVLLVTFTALLLIRRGAWLGWFILTNDRQWSLFSCPLSDSGFLPAVIY